MLWWCYLVLFVYHYWDIISGCIPTRKRSTIVEMWYNSHGEHSKPYSMLATLLELALWWPRFDRQFGAIRTTRTVSEGWKEAGAKFINQFSGEESASGNLGELGSIRVTGRPRLYWLYVDILGVLVVCTNVLPSASCITKKYSFCQCLGTVLVGTRFGNSTCWPNFEETDNRPCELSKLKSVGL